MFYPSPVIAPVHVDANLVPREQPFSSWYVPPGFDTFDIVQPSGHRWGPAHVFDDGELTIIVRGGDRERYSAGGYYMSIESDPSKPGQHFLNVDSALAEARRIVLEHKRKARR